MYQEVVLFVVGGVDAVEEREQRLLVLAALGLALLEVELEGLVHQRLPFQDVRVVLSLDALPFVLQLFSGAIFKFSVQLLEVIRVVAQQELEEFLLLTEAPRLVDSLYLLQRDVRHFVDSRLVADHFEMRKYISAFLSLEQLE